MSTLTVYSTTKDGFVGFYHATYATAHNAADGNHTSANSTVIEVVNLWSGSLYQIERGFLYFDTSSLPDNCTPVSATVSLFGYSSAQADSGHSSLQLYAGSQSDTLENADYDAFGATALSDDFTNWEYPLGTEDYSAITLNASGLAIISKTGTTKFCVRIKGDIDTSTPTGTNKVQFWASEMTAGYKPRLVIEYTVPTVPTVTTQAVTAIADTTATGNGNVTSDGGATITERGTCISISPNPTIYETKDTSAGTTGAFTTSIDTLTSGLTYHVRAYATNSVGTSYGDDVEFTTLTTPTVSTQAVTAIASTTATGNGDVVSDGGSTITERGVCYCLFADGTPDTSDSKKITTGTTGVFTASLTGLTKATKYNIRAYATNTYGTNYGVLTDFITLAEAPTVTTQAASAITDTTATGNGNITVTGGENCTERGICWNLTGTPTISDNYVSEQGSFSTGAFTASLVNLPFNDTIYARAYAANSIGGSYGDAVNFNTLNEVAKDDFSVPVCAITIRLANIYFDNTVPFTIPICAIDCECTQPYYGHFIIVPICVITCAAIQGLHAHLLNHPILNPEYFDEPKLVNRVYVVGVNSDGNTVYGEDKDALIEGEVLQIYPDSMINTRSDAETIAGNIRTKARLTVPRGQITIPPAIQMELWDVIEIDDEICNQSDALYRVAGWMFNYQTFIPNRQEAKYEMIVKLTAV